MNSISKISRNRPLLGTFVEITAFIPQNLDEDKVSDIVKDAYLNIERLELILSKHNPKSTLSNLNSCRYLKNPPQELFEIIRIGNFISYMTKGLFDITAESRLDGSYKDIFCSRHCIKFLQDLQINLGGIAKGYIVDLTAKFLLQCGIKNAIINAGGDIRFCGSMLHPIYVRNPFDPSKYFNLGNFSNCSIASSSITLAAKNRGGKSKTVKHKTLVNPEKSHQKLVHATTISSYKNYSCTIADALTKPLLLGWELEKLSKLDYILADKNMNFITNIKQENGIAG